MLVVLVCQKVWFLLIIFLFFLYGCHWPRNFLSKTSARLGDVPSMEEGRLASYFVPYRWLL